MTATDLMTTSDDAILQATLDYLTPETGARLIWITRRPCLAGSGEILDLVSEILTEGIEIGYVDGYLDGHHRGRLWIARQFRRLKNRMARRRCARRR